MANRIRTALIVSIALLLTSLTGCARTLHGVELYQSAQQQFLSTATTMHRVLMAIHPGDWTVPTGGYGAVPIACSRGWSGDFGYMFSYRRDVDVDISDAAALQERATEAFARAGLESSSPVYGTGQGAEWNVIAEDASIGRLVVTVIPSAGRVEVSADSPCVAGDAGELRSMIIEDDTVTTWRSLPAFEGPTSVPLFYFPADGPLYFREDGTPIEPQPVVTVAPVSPWSTPGPTP
ncbi:MULTISPECIES: hypothetical protein [Microbacterium]|uniref:hypothetical protein n=1 Tax=Microbacterium TaxID=33882 RepID=UPI001E2F03A5|nr:hypothetical protein [Microbacterium nymphoidis]MCD2500084.1 hypothetical protein [Microbacterium nymphoidis]